MRPGIGHHRRWHPSLLVKFAGLSLVLVIVPWVALSGQLGVIVRQRALATNEVAASQLVAYATPCESWPPSGYAAGPSGRPHGVRRAVCFK